MSKVSLSLEEIEQLGELLARIPEAFTPMEPDKLDGFLTALTLMKNPPAQPDWMNYVFDIDGNPRARLSQHEQAQLQKLILRRGREIEETVLSEKPIDPILYDTDELTGEPLEGEESLAALSPFADGIIILQRGVGHDLRRAVDGFVDTDRIVHAVNALQKFFGFGA